MSLKKQRVRNGFFLCDMIRNILLCPCWSFGL
jgi:hypothetical protein